MWPTSSRGPIASLPRGVTLAGAVVIAVLVVGVACANSASAANDLILREDTTKQRFAVPSSLFAEVRLPECEEVYFVQLEKNVSATDKLVVAGGGPEPERCSREQVLGEGGELNSISLSSAGKATLVYSSAPEVAVFLEENAAYEPIFCTYSFPTKWSGKFAPSSSADISGKVNGTLVRPASTGCSSKDHLAFEVPLELSGIVSEVLPATVKAEAKVQWETRELCGTASPHTVVGTAQFTRSTETNEVTVTYKVAGEPVLANHEFRVELYDTTGYKPPETCLFIGEPLAKKTELSTFKTNANGDGTFTGFLRVPEFDTEFFVQGFSYIPYQVDGSLIVKLP